MGYGGAFVESAKEVEIVPFSQKQTEQYIETWFTNAAGYIKVGIAHPTKLKKILPKQQREQNQRRSFRLFLTDQMSISHHSLQQQKVSLAG